MNNRALSHMVSYVLLLGITIILISGLSIAGSGLLEGQHEQTVSEELDVIGERVAADILTADRLAETDGEPHEIRVTSNTPHSTSGGQYHIGVENDGSETFILVESQETGITENVSINTTTDVRETQVRGGNTEIHYNETDDMLVVTNG